MSVFKRATSRGETPEYHYRFMSRGKDYAGVCEGCRTKKAAEEYEASIRKKAGDLARQKTAKALVENFRDDLTGGTKIPLVNAFELSLAKPRKRYPSPALVVIKRSYWRDFTRFMESRYPGVDSLADVRRCHAEEYVQYLRENGRFDKAVEYTSGEIAKRYSRKGNLSPKSVNTIHQTLKEVFDKLSHDAGLIDNPFDAIPKLDNAQESREAFSREELALISQSLTPFVKPIFIIGTTTGMREGDICMLRWADVNLKAGFVVRKTLKTGAVVEIPITAPLDSFLREQWKLSGAGEFVLPEHAAMYQQNRVGVSRRFRLFLEGLGIKTTKQVPGRTRTVSVKDVHSLRHTFCYFAGVHGIPLSIVQSIVGHMTPEMTRHYQSHADRKTKHDMMEKMPDLLSLPVIPALDTEDSALRRDIAALMETATAEQLRQAKAALEGKDLPHRR